MENEDENTRRIKTEFILQMDGKVKKIPFCTDWWIKKPVIVPLLHAQIGHGTLTLQFSGGNENCYGSLNMC